MSQWKDVSWFAESAKERTPHTFELQLGGLKLGLARHVAYPGKWIAHLHPLFVTHILEAEELEAAQKEAVALAKEHVQKVVSDLGAVT
jgi:hypothetical protein